MRSEWGLILRVSKRTAKKRGRNGGKGKEAATESEGGSAKDRSSTEGVRS